MHAQGKESRGVCHVLSETVMKTRTVNIILSISCLALVLGHGSEASQAESGDGVSPNIETIVLRPLSLDSISILVPADAFGPVLNHSCRTERNRICNFSLPSKVTHEKEKDCPSSVPRLLAEYAAVPHENSIPLTIFGSWKWEYANAMSQL